MNKNKLGMGSVLLLGINGIIGSGIFCYQIKQPNLWVQLAFSF